MDVAWETDGGIENDGNGSGGSESPDLGTKGGRGTWTTLCSRARRRRRLMRG